MDDETKFHGIIGDMNPVEHGGGVVFENGYGPQVVYFGGWSAEGEARVTVSTFSVEESVLEDLSWVDWAGVASYVGLSEEELRGHATSENVLARAKVYESVGQYHGFGELDLEPLELTLEQAEEEYGDFVDRAHASG